MFDDPPPAHLFTDLSPFRWASLPTEPVVAGRSRRHASCTASPFPTRSRTSASREAIMLCPGCAYMWHRLRPLAQCAGTRTQQAAAACCHHAIACLRAWASSKRNRAPAVLAWLRLRRPRPVHGLCRFFLTGVPAPIPPGLVAALYASVYPHTTWRFLGCVSNEQVRNPCSYCSRGPGSSCDW
eukprot:COSAG01_NODE_2830_length_6998_cov_17.705754_10_plen_183_part_00